MTDKDTPPLPATGPEHILKADGTEYEWATGEDAAPRTPNPDAVRRIVAHLWGEDFDNIKAAVESFGNGYTVVPSAAQGAAAPPDLETLKRAAVLLEKVLPWIEPLAARDEANDILARLSADLDEEDRP